MPVQPNLLERAAFYTLNAAPGPMLDLAGALAYRTISTAVHLNIFTSLAARPATATELAERLSYQERGVDKLLKALAVLGYVTVREGRYHNTPMTEKWFLDETTLDLNAAVTCWDAFLSELWPHAPAIVRNGERPFNFYDFTAATPGLSHAHQQMMMGNANLFGPDLIKKIPLPADARLLDIGGGHGMYSVHFCLAHPTLRATIVDSAIALETAALHVAEHNLGDRITLRAGDIWEIDWGEEHDLVLLFNFIHQFDAATNVQVLQKAHAALRSGGRVAILDQFEGKVFGAATNAVIQLVGFMYYLFADGRVYSRDEIGAMLAEAGFTPPAFHSSPRWAGTSLATAVA